MEKVLGYKIDYGSSLDGGSPRFYSDLRLVPDHVYGRTLREFDEQLEPDSVAERIDISMEAPMQLAVKQVGSAYLHPLNLPIGRRSSLEEVS